jgi:hypothetical protein
VSAENVVKALKMVAKQRKSKKPFDTSFWWRITICGISLSERINGILKQDFLIEKCSTNQELEVLIKESIETYNNKRPHLSLNMRTPNFIHKKNRREYSLRFKLILFKNCQPISGRHILQTNYFSFCLISTSS